MLRSRLIAWLRIILPLAALAILSTMFLVSRTPNPDDALPYAEVDAEDLARDPRMTRPEFAGVSDGGAEVTLTAAEARPGAGTDSSAQRLRLTWRTKDGLAADLTAPDAKLDGQVVLMSGGVRMTTSDGWAMTVPQVESDMETDRLLGTGGLTAFAPMGRLDAQTVEITRTDDGQQLLNLSGDVRLVYQP
ncbi:hypothetical protein FQV27_15795 [Paracoccus aurantiacus]|uniref:LPS export ABC transporter periplasmic protein LptC n=1 Tax=Paracoccus aurantiacus TaxID=2599412 RepID=A0A5C6RWE3_9RHOB|nr:hypothetical protein [Paracoccus aurantiacus]TXB66374.1 hypothetical protein FQV27_15795 [Paracoccus aurantiacus]